MAYQSISDDEFRAKVAPFAAGVRSFALTVFRLEDTHNRLPAADSPAMSELAEEHSYEGRGGWDHPIVDAHLIGSLTLRAAADSCRGVAGLFTLDEMPVYPQFVLARAALDAAVAAEWLNRTGIDVRERIKRALFEYTYSAIEFSELNLSEAGAKDLEKWREVPPAYGWEVSRERHRDVIDGAKRPNLGEGIARLAASGPESRVGDALFSRLSAVTHATWFGLDWAFTDTSRHGPAAGIATMHVGASLTTACVLFVYMTRALRAAADARTHLMGWNDSAWRTASDEAAALEQSCIAVAIPGLKAAAASR
jgi:hypothetical protein